MFTDFNLYHNYSTIKNNFLSLWWTAEIQTGVLTLLINIVSISIIPKSFSVPSTKESN